MKTPGTFRSVSSAGEARRGSSQDVPGIIQVGPRERSLRGRIDFSDRGRPRSAGRCFRPSRGIVLGSARAKCYARRDDRIQASPPAETQFRARVDSGPGAGQASDAPLRMGPDDPVTVLWMRGEELLGERTVTGKEAASALLTLFWISRRPTCSDSPRVSEFRGKAWRTCSGKACLAPLLSFELPCRNCRVCSRNGRAYREVLSAQECRCTARISTWKSRRSLGLRRSFWRWRRGTPFLRAPFSECAALSCDWDRKARTLSASLDTSGRPELKPQKPSRVFELTERDAILIFDQSFATPKRARMARPPRAAAKRHIPYRVD